MYIFFGDGYLGNQLFQYSFIKFYLKPKKLFTTNFFPLLEFLEKDKKLKIYSLENRVLVFFLRRFLIFILKFMSFIRLINSVSLDTYRYKGTIIERDKINKKSGIIPITFIYPHFFQNKKFHNSNNKKKIMIKKKHISRAKKFLDSISKDKNINVQKMMIKDLPELYSVSKMIDDDSELLFILKDHMVVSGIQTLAQAAKQRQIPVVTSDEGSVIEGGAFALGVQEQDIGRGGAKMALSVLDGQVPSDMPIQVMEALSIFYNPKACRAQGIDVARLQAVAKELGYRLQERTTAQRG